MNKDELLLYVNTKDMLLGEVQRFNHRSHGCSGSSNSLVVTRTLYGIQAYCHRCGERYNERLSSFHPVKMAKTASKLSRIPKDATTKMTTWPLQVQNLMYMYGLTESDAQVHRILYSDSEKRLIISAQKGFVTKKVYDTDPKPKYLSYNNPSYWYIQSTDSNTIILTEDKLSGIVLSKVFPSCSTLSLFGTKLKDDHLALLLRMGYNRIIVWLDDDNSIVKSQQIKIKNRLGMYFDEVILILEGDPKRMFIPHQI